MPEPRFYQRPGWWHGPVMGIVIGGVLGWGYYFLIGCRTGSCAITGNPVNSTAYGALLGLIWTFPGQKKNRKISQSNDNRKTV
ncbi:MAG: hypothetical protein ACE5D1_01175 [Fidelibacterota bacterium]